MLGAYGGEERKRGGVITSVYPGWGGFMSFCCWGHSYRGGGGRTGWGKKKERGGIALEGTLSRKPELGKGKKEQCKFLGGGGGERENICPVGKPSCLLGQTGWCFGGGGVPRKERSPPFPC